MTLPFFLSGCCRVSAPDYYLPPPPPDFLISLGRLLPRHLAADDLFPPLLLFSSKNPAGGPGASPHLASSPVRPAFTVPVGLGIGKLPDTAATTARPGDAPRTASKSAKKEKEKDKEKDKDAIGPDGGDATVRKDGKTVLATPEHRGTDGFAGRVDAGEDVVMAAAGGPLHHEVKGVLVGDVPEKPSGKRKKDVAVVVDHVDEMQGVEAEPPRKETEKKETEKKRKRHVADEDLHPPHAVAEEKGTKHTASHSKARPSTSDGLSAVQQTPNKRGARKRADSHAALTATPVTRAMKVEEPEEEEAAVAEDEDADADAEDDGEGDEDEPVYCYCQQVSYGEMVACDAENCPREWFHLDCVGLQQAPRSKGMVFLFSCWGC